MIWLEFVTTAKESEKPLRSRSEVKPAFLSDELSKPVSKCCSVMVRVGPLDAQESPAKNDLFEARRI
jgi:hypothetical protein